MPFLPQGLDDRFQRAPFQSEKIGLFGPFAHHSHTDDLPSFLLDDSGSLLKGLWPSRQLDIQAGAGFQDPHQLNKGRQNIGCG